MLIVRKGLKDHGKAELFVVLLVSGATIALPTPQPELLWDLVQR